MPHSRRDFLATTATLAATLAAADILRGGEGATPKYSLSACDWSLRATDVSALDVAKAIGLDGVEASVGRQPVPKLPLSDPKVREEYKAKMKATGVVLSSTALGILNRCPLASDERGPAWIDQAIEASADLNARVILLAFFGNGDLRAKKGGGLKKQELDAVIGRLKDVAPKAKEKGVILGIENTLSAKDNAMILDRIRSDAAGIYYDVGNSTRNGYKVPAEIRMLRDRICQFHFKDHGGWLGTKVQLEPIREAIEAIGYRGWIVLETQCPTGKREADFRKNAETVRKLFGMKG